ncbi:MAG: hypothetical protein KA954_11415 [Chitinophagales bacterium]|nr:hypothetical protein [Chitinophagales bacterium]MBP9704631.1 hypothetical protein [Chitinophagales bacterium]
MKKEYYVVKLDYYPSPILATLAGRKINLSKENVELLEEYRAQKQELDKQNSDDADKNVMHIKNIILTYQEASLPLPEKGGPTIVAIPFNLIEEIIID